MEWVQSLNKAVEYIEDNLQRFRYWQIYGVGGLCFQECGDW